MISFIKIPQRQNKALVLVYFEELISFLAVRDIDSAIGVEGQVGVVRASERNVAIVVLQVEFARASARSHRVPVVIVPRVGEVNILARIHCDKLAMMGSQAYLSVSKGL